MKININELELDKFEDFPEKEKIKKKKLDRENNSPIKKDKKVHKPKRGDDD